MLEALARVARGFIVGRDKRQMPEMAHDNLRALFQTLPANRSNTLPNTRPVRSTLVSPTAAT